MYFPQLPELAEFCQSRPRPDYHPEPYWWPAAGWPVCQPGQRGTGYLAERIVAVAACPNVYMKLGGIGMPRTGFDWHVRNKPIGSEELATSMSPFMTYCIEQFGPDRCMFESNFPVDKVSYSYNVMYNAFKRLSKGYSAAERAAMFHDTAARLPHRCLVLRTASASPVWRGGQSLF